ncbi:MAG: hypothetical protein WAU24_14175 [Chitinophagaceae bacterium]
MKQTLLFSYFFLVSVCGMTQNIDTIPGEPQTIELTMSTPQPRLNETFQISLDFNQVRESIFNPLFGKVQLSTDINITDNDKLTINVNALKKGKNEMGPLVFFLNNTKYTTNKIVYEVVDALPNVDRGIWFRKVMTSETTFCIIIEQRIPATNTMTTEADNIIKYSTEPENTEIVKFKDGFTINGANGSNSLINTNFGSVKIKGEDKEFMSGFSVYYFSINDPNAIIKITKDKFQNIPAGYTFEDINIQ